MTAPSARELRRAEVAAWRTGPGGAPANRAERRRQAKLRTWTAHLVGFRSVELPPGMVINDLWVMTGKNGGSWVAIPGATAAGPGRQSLARRHGKPTLSQIVESSS